LRQLGLECLFELTIVNSLESTILEWQQSGLTLLPPNSEAAVYAALNATGRKYSRDVVALYHTTGGMADINSTVVAGRFGHWIVLSPKTCGIKARIFYSPISLSRRTCIASNIKIPNARRFASTISMARSLEL
jgi:hypothetical protein